MLSFWALLLMGLLAAVLVSRFTGRLDRSWPLIVWALLVVIANSYEGAIYPIVIYVGVICALFLRFEFMGGFVLKAIRLIEAVAILLILWRLFVVIRGW